MNCPLCHKELIFDPDHITVNFTIDKDLICPIKLDLSYYKPDAGRRIYLTPYHYRRSAIRKRQIIFIDRFRVMEDAPGSFDVAAWTDNPLPTDMGHWRRIGIVPVFDIKSEAHLLQKLRLIMVFS